MNCRFVLIIKDVHNKDLSSLFWSLNRPGVEYEMEYDDLYVSGEAPYWKLALIIGDCVLYGNVECFLFRGDKDEQVKEVKEVK